MDRLELLKDKHIAIRESSQGPCLEQLAVTAPRPSSGDVALVLRPVLLVDVAIVLERARRGLKGHAAAAGVRDRPDDAVVVLGHAHRHLRRRLAVEGQGALLGYGLGRVQSRRA